MQAVFSRASCSKFRDVFAAVLMTGVASISVAEAKATITTFNGPGAPDALAFAINDGGSIVGYYADDAGLHGFVRAPDGTTTAIDPLGSVSCWATAINDSGVITGWYEDTSGFTHGFLRASDGTITPFDPAGSIVTIPASINKEGAIAGYYYDGNDQSHSFVRAADGTITSFDPPGATNDFAFGLNKKGEIVGAYTSGTSYMGYLRNPDGTFVSFSAGGNTSPAGINDKGEITGSYWAMPHDTAGFIRAVDGNFISFQGSARAGVTTPTSLNAKGITTGYWQHALASHATAFVRRADGSVTNFDVTGAGTGRHQGTFAMSINKKGSIAGWYEDSNGVTHGFVRTP